MTHIDFYVRQLCAGSHQQRHHANVRHCVNLQISRTGAAAGQIPPTTLQGPKA
jgi:hypothetical protein